MGGKAGEGREGGIEIAGFWQKQFDVVLSD